MGELVRLAPIQSEVQSMRTLAATCGISRMPQPTRSYPSLIMKGYVEQ